MEKKNQITHFYTKEKGCPFCKNLVVKKIDSRSVVTDSDIVCISCGAIFKGLNCSDESEQGMFFGKYITPPAESLYSSPKS